jgi:hypothetical protein
MIPDQRKFNGVHALGPHMRSTTIREKELKDLTDKENYANATTGSLNLPIFRKIILSQIFPNFFRSKPFHLMKISGSLRWSNQILTSSFLQP